VTSHYFADFILGKFSETSLNVPALKYSSGSIACISEVVAFVWFGWSDIIGYDILMVWIGCDVLMVWMVGYQRLWYSNDFCGRISEVVAF
jgi:hypothetical protein